MTRIGNLDVGRLELGPLTCWWWCRVGSRRTRHGVSSRVRCYYHSTKMGLVVIVVAPVLASKAASKARAGLLLAALRT
jgi:hypothetical protein